MRISLSDPQQASCLWWGLSPALASHPALGPTACPRASPRGDGLRQWHRVLRQLWSSAKKSCLGSEFVCKVVPEVRGLLQPGVEGNELLGMRSSWWWMLRGWVCWSSWSSVNGKMEKQFGLSDDEGWAGREEQVCVPHSPMNSLLSVYRGLFKLSFGLVRVRCSLVSPSLEVFYCSLELVML